MNNKEKIKFLNKLSTIQEKNHWEICMGNVGFVLDKLRKQIKEGEKKQ